VNYTGESRYKIANTTGRILFYSVNHSLIDLFKTGIKHYIMDILLILPHTRETKQIYSGSY